MQTWINFKKELLKNPAVKKAYDELGPEFNLIKLMIQKRLEKGLTQKQLAKKMGIKQPMISRFEQGMSNPTLKFLGRIAKGLDSKIKITIS
ncbi:MAG: hypothetical protein A3K08_01665 [Candidatus Doudnabacteria bacterium RIFCSPLOWO2_01_41_7]|nr:MAG: hypothetical protein A3K08_01665 [Candidatus Doudnabacteria bacterium RIFCSPLOWO2_01_41_7]